MADNNNPAQDTDRGRVGRGGAENPGDAAAEISGASRAFWGRQNESLSAFRSRYEKRAQKRRAAKGANLQQSWKRETWSLPRAEAQAKAREFLRKYPKAAYWSEVESWRELPGDIIEFTMRRLPTAD